MSGFENIFRIPHETKMAIVMDSHELELCFCCAVALPTVIIKNRKAEYSTLYDIAIDVVDLL